MNRNKLFLLGVTLIAIALLFFYFYDKNLTGLFGLGAAKQQPEQINAENESAMQAGISFTVLQPTTLEASVSNGAKLVQCPQETAIEITVKNRGGSVAEKVFLKFGSGIKVIACNNCRTDALQPKQEVLANALLCVESTQPNSLVVGSANSNRIEMELEQ
jgi:hypothetical protein